MNARLGENTTQEGNASHSRTEIPDRRITPNEMETATSSRELSPTQTKTATPNREITPNGMKTAASSRDITKIDGDCNI